MTKRSRGVSNTRCKAIVNSTTPRFGPGWAPIWERTLISSSRTSCASCGRSCSRSALISTGERIPSSRRVGAAVAWEVSEEFDFVICACRFVGHVRRCLLLLRWLELFNYGFARAVAGNDFDLLLSVGQSFLANFYQIHSFLKPNDKTFRRKLARLHCFNNFFTPFNSTSKSNHSSSRLRFPLHG